jgi:hypothetical protein
MLYWIYIVIISYLALVLFIEFFKEEKWINQVAIAMVLIPFVLRILQIK